MMVPTFLKSSFLVLAGASIACQLSDAQVRPGGGSTGPSRTPVTSSPSLPNQPQAVFISGKVLIQGAGSPTEPVAIERVCNGAVRREGYTDFKGNFEFQFGQSNQGRNAEESGRDVFNNSGNRGQTQGMGSEVDVSGGTFGNADSLRKELLGCEIRASLTGFKSSTAMLRPDGSSWQLEVGTLILTRMENVGATISLTSMSAPGEAKRAFEKGEKLVGQSKYSDAEKELSKAVKEYPQFAAAWSLLGEVHRQQNQGAQAKTEYLQAISIDPQFINPYFGMTVLAIHEKNWDDALKYSSEVKKLSTGMFPLAWMYNAAANFYLQKLDAAEESARQFKIMDKEHKYPESLLLLANILSAKHDYSGAAQELDEYLQAVPAAPNAEAIKQQEKQLKDMSSAKQR